MVFFSFIADYLSGNLSANRQVIRQL